MYTELHYAVTQHLPRLMRSLRDSAMVRFVLVGLCTLLAVSGLAADYPPAKEGDYVIRNFNFRDTKSLPEIRIHYATIGTPKHNTQGAITNAVLLLHGTSGSGKQFLQAQFADELYGPGKPLDANRYYIILPDNVGFGSSSKPSDGLHMHFPRYDYYDLVTAQHRLLTEALGVQHLRLILGTSMGCMHAFIWGETHADFMDAVMPLACQTVPISGRNRVWRDAAMNAIKLDPAWNNGEYKEQPVGAIRTAQYMFAMAVSAPLLWQRLYPTPDASRSFVDSLESRVKTADANDLLYQVDASRNYDPSENLEKILVPVMWINFSDDFINPPELAIPERDIKRIPRGQFHLVPASDQTHGHLTHTWPVFWKQYLVQLLHDSEPK